MLRPILRLAARRRIHIEGYPNLQKDVPYIFASTHSFVDDVIVNYACVDRSAYMLVGTPDQVEHNPAMYAAWLNGMVFVDKLDPQSRKDSVEKMVRVLESGSSVILYPEGAWNNTENLLVQPLFAGAAEMALRTGAKIVPIAIEQYGKRYCANIGEPIDPRAYRQAPCEAGAGTAGMPGREEKQRLTDHLRDVLCILRWEIWAQAAPAARADLSETAAAEYLEGIMRESEKGYTVEEILRTRFHPKETSPAEAFAFLQKLKPCRENAFLLRGREAYLRREPPQ